MTIILYHIYELIMKISDETDTCSVVVVVFNKSWQLKRLFRVFLLFSD